MAGDAIVVARDGEPGYQIGAVSKLTGIPIDTLRAWERRYGAVTPRREGGDRTYSSVDVARLRLLQQASAAGHSIGRIARLSEESLRQLIAEPPPSGAAPASAIDRSRLRAAVLGLDTAAIDYECGRLATAVRPLELVRDVLFPTMREVGEAWLEGRGGIAQEHVMSGAVRHLLGSFLRLYLRREGATRLVFATPAGERHEIGILGAAMLAANEGCTVSYVGPDLPAREIVAAVAAAHAQVLVLGVTLAQNVRPMAGELTAIARRLPPEVDLWVGGPGAARHARVLGPRARVFESIDAYQEQLTRLAAR